MNLLLLTAANGTAQLAPPTSVEFGYGGWQGILTVTASLLFVLVLG